jgi:undecaprenyl-diphosphatase
MSDIISSIILGIIEGLTEFLPISSTGHLILAEQFIGKEGSFANTAFTEAFDIIIQLGAILSVVFYFWKKLFPFSSHKSLAEKRETYALWMKSIIGVIPALILGVLLNDFIKAKLFNPTVVAIALIVWGLVLILVEQRVRRAKVSNLSMLTVQMALMIGLIQCLAMVPGTSRSAATIVGAMMLGCSRLVAAEFSFFLAIPTMVAASGYSMLKLLKSGIALTNHDFMVLGIGFFVSFVVAYMVIAAFIRFISQNDFRSFGYYRIVLGIIVLVYFGLIQH